MYINIFSLSSLFIFSQNRTQEIASLLLLYLDAFMPISLLPSFTGVKELCPAK